MDSKIQKVIYRLCKCMILLLFLIVFVGCMILPSEWDDEALRCDELNVEWEWLKEDGSRQKITVPVKLDVDRNFPVVIEAILPGRIEDDSWVCFRGSQQDMSIYIDGELRKHFDTKDTRPVGKCSMDAYVFLRLSAADEGRVIRVVTVSDSAQSGTMNQVYIGDRFGIWLTLVKQHGPDVIIALMILILAIVDIGCSIVIYKVYRRHFPMEYLGWVFLLAAFWVLSQTKLRQLIFTNFSLVATMSFVAVMLIPLPCVMYINSLQKGRYQRLHLATEAVILLNSVVCCILQIFGLVDFVDSMKEMHSIVILAALVTMGTLLKDAVDGHLGEYRLVAFGLVAFVLSAIVEIFLMYASSIHTIGLVLVVGLVILLLMTIWGTAKDILHLEKTKQSALCASEAKSSFLANMSHEIRTPINSVIGLNELIIRESSEEKIRGYASDIRSSSKMLLALVNDILDFSKIESGKMKLVEIEYHMAELVRNVTRILKARANEKNLTILLDIDEKLPTTLLGDEVRVQQICVNLLTNAVKYTEKGSVTFRLRVNQEKPFLLLIQVTDTGIGIKPEDLKKIFDGFSRADLKRNRHIEGTGLGLSITKKLVELMEGSIQVESEYGKGSSFTVVIPQRVINATCLGLWSQDENELQDMEVQSGGFFVAPEARILVVDDNAMNLAVVRGLLKRTAVMIDTASGGEMALKMTTEKKYDLILMDHMMPGMDGIETLHRIKDDPVNPNRETKQIALTANAIAGAKEFYIKEGFMDYLTKPVDPDKLENLIAEHLPAELVKYGKEDSTDSESEVPIDREEGLRYCGGLKELYIEILEEYVKGENKAALNRALEQGDLHDYGVCVHAVKSSSKTIGATAFSELAYRMEMAAKEGNEKTVHDKHADFIRQYDVVIKAAKKVLEEIQ